MGIEGALSEISETWLGFTELRRWGRGGSLLERVQFSKILIKSNFMFACNISSARLWAASGAIMRNR